MREYVTVANELVIAEEIQPINEYGGIIIVQDTKGLRHVVKRKHRRLVVRSKRIDISVGQHVRVTSPDGKVQLFRSTSECANALGTRTTYVNRYARKPAKSGKWFGWKFEKLG